MFFIMSNSGCTECPKKNGTRINNDVYALKTYEGKPVIRIRK